MFSQPTKPHFSLIIAQFIVSLALGCNCRLLRVVVADTGVVRQFLLGVDLLEAEIASERLVIHSFRRIWSLIDALDSKVAAESKGRRMVTNSSLMKIFTKQKRIALAQLGMLDYLLVNGTTENSGTNDELRVVLKRDK